MSSPEVLRGGCACGAVAYAVEDAFAYALHCHCSLCRRRTGAAFKTIGGVEVGRLRLTSGEDQVLRVGDSPLWHDVRCAACHSLLWSVVRDGAWAHVTYGTLLDPPSLQPQKHIMVAHKAPWFEIADDLPQHAEWG
jgi:hypothetical protein